MFDEPTFFPSLPGLRPAVIRPETPVSQIVEEMAARLDRLGRSERTRQCVPASLRVFARFHPGPVGLLTSQVVEAFIDSRGPLSARTKNNWADFARMIVNFSIKRHYLPKWFDGLDALERWTETPKPVGIYTPEQLRAVLRVASPQIVAGLACVCFAGVRTAEVHRLTWADVDLSRRLIFVSAGNAKTRSRRLCPVSDNLAAWLAPLRGAASERLCKLTEKGFNEALRCARLKTGVPAVANGWRHSFVSYRVAVTGSVESTALEAGNSPVMIHKHYREAVTRESGLAWFEVWPARQLEFRLAA